MDTDREHIQNAMTLLSLMNRRVFTLDEINSRITNALKKPGLTSGEREELLIFTQLLAIRSNMRCQSISTDLARRNGAEIVED